MQKYFQDHIILNTSDRLGRSITKTGDTWHIEENKLTDKLTYGVFVNSQIVKGRIGSIDCSKAKKISGVHAVICYLNKPDIPEWKHEERKCLYLFNDDKIFYHRQPLALVIADSFMSAAEAAQLVKITYVAEDDQAGLNHADPATAKSQPTKNFEENNHEAQPHPHVVIESRYNNFLHQHDHSKIHAALGIDESMNELTDDDRAIVMQVIKKDIASSLSLKEEDIKIHIQAGVNSFKPDSALLPHEMAAILGVKKTGKTLVVLASHEQLFKMANCKTVTSQHVILESSMDGCIGLVTHEADDLFNHKLKAQIARRAVALYACNYSQVANKNMPDDLPAFHVMAPEYEDVCFALESMLDELSYLINLDPVALRIRNFAEVNNKNVLPFCDDYFKECCALGEKNFGWSGRSNITGSMHSGQWLLGMGMSAGMLFIAESSDFKMSNSGEDFSLTHTSHQHLTEIIVNNNGHEKLSIKSFCANFVEVLVHPNTGKIIVSRVVIAIDARVIGDIKVTARLVYDLVRKAIEISLAKEQQSANYFDDGVHQNQHHQSLPLKINAPLIEIVFANQNNVGSDKDEAAGHIELTGLSAAIANAVHHATGRRVRHLPIKLEN